ncbi:MAG: cobalamin B12-binding domain-containing protein [Candidatus Kariarchaeaceae archaeon]|jgi:corrinoid protein of di/trimethylamine methyltransferase
MTLLKEIAETIVDGDEEKTLKLVRTCLNKNMDVNTIIDEGLALGIREVGRLWEEGEYFLPELMQGAEIMKAAMDLLKPVLLEQKKTDRAIGRAVIGTVAGDIHDIGKTLVASMLTASGFEVFDLGADVSIDNFIEVAESKEANLICLSALLTTTMLVQRDLISELVKRGLRDKYKVIVGGAPINLRWANEINADGYAENAVAAVKLASSLLNS